MRCGALARHWRAVVAAQRAHWPHCIGEHVDLRRLSRRSLCFAHGASRLLVALALHLFVQRLELIESLGTHQATLALRAVPPIGNERLRIGPAALTADPARRTTPRRRARPPGDRARERPPAAVPTSATASGTRRHATARPRPRDGCAPRSPRRR